MTTPPNPVFVKGWILYNLSSPEHKEEEDDDDDDEDIARQNNKERKEREKGAD